MHPSSYTDNCCVILFFSSFFLFFRFMIKGFCFAQLYSCTPTNLVALPQHGRANVGHIGFMEKIRLGHV